VQGLRLGPNDGEEPKGTLPQQVTPMTYNRMEAKPIAGEHCRFCGDTTAPLVKTPCCDQWICCDTAFFRFEGAGGAKWSTSASACAIPPMRTNMAARGKVVRSAVSSGRHEITKGMRKTRSIGQDIEWWWKVNEVQIPGTKNARYRAFLDSLPMTAS
jgi:hypothetical protein